MKTKLLYLGFLLGVTIQTFAQPAMNPLSLPYYEGFNYPIGGNLIGQGNWDFNGSGAYDETIENDNLVYANLPAPTGSALNFRGGGPDPISYFTPQTTGTVYYSFLMRINTATTDFYTNLVNSTGIQFISLGLQSSTPANTNYGSCVMIRRTDATGVINLGYNIDSQAANTVWDTANITVGTTYFVVASFTFDGTAPVGKLWINPVITTTEPASNITTSLFTNNRTSLDRVFIRQDSNARTPDMTIDELRVSTSWVEATGGVLSTPTIELASKINFYPNPAKNTLSFNSNDLAIDSILFYTVEGKEVLNIKNFTNNTLDISSLSKGIYSVRVTTQEGVLNKKIIVK